MPDRPTPASVGSRAQDHVPDGGRATHHGLAVHEVLVLAGSDPELGLSTAEVADRARRYGPNVAPVAREAGPVVRFLLQLNNPLIYVLLAAFVVTFALGETVDAAVIAGVVLVNATVGFVQEQRATAALAALAELTRTRARVLRDRAVVQVDSAELVPGDVVLLEAGDKVPADARLIEVHELRVDESSLTGESEPVTKHALVLAPETALADRRNMAWSGTLVTAGTGRGVVVAIGAETEIGQIQQYVGAARGVSTPLMRRLAHFGRWLTVVIVALAILAFVLGMARGESLPDMVTAAVALAVAAIPEGLPAAVTITLAIGVSRMARRRAIIRKLPAAETLGSTTVICTDKTGTLTRNRMTVQHLVVDGEIHDAGTAERHRVLDCLTAGVLCTGAHLRLRDDGTLHAAGDPTETALLDIALAHGVDQRTELAARPRIDEVPFSSDSGWMATLHDDPAAGARLVVVKGSVESVLPMCGAAGAPGSGQGWGSGRIDEAVAELTGRGLRVLAFAWGRSEDDDLPDAVPTGLTFLGLQAMADPLRPEAVDAVAACRRAGIAVKMITGDHPRTAAAIGRAAGLGPDEGTGPAVLTGAELDGRSLAELAELLDRTDVVARVTAGEKLRIVEALQERGHVVAMTGDGVNDAPALKQADIGVAMGEGGTEVAKESSAMVLADDNFATIEAAVEEGRGIYDNLVKFINWTLPTNIGEGLIVLVAVAVGTALPMTPVQILWVNMTTAVALGLMLAFEPAEPGIMSRPPRAPREPIVTRSLAWRMVAVGVLMLIGAFVAFQATLAGGATIEQARTVAVNVFVAMEAAYLLNCRSLTGSVLSAGLFSNRWLLAGVGVTLALQALFTFTPWMQAAFGTAAPPPGSWLLVVAMAVALLLLVGALKWASARRDGPPAVR